MEGMEDFQILTRIFSGEISLSEQKKIDAWLAASPANRELYETVKGILDNAVPSDHPELPDIEQEWRSLANNLNLALAETATNQSIPDRQRKHFFRDLFSFQWQPAINFAVVCLLAVGAFLVWQSTATPELLTLETSAGNQESITLSDGSTVYLNHESQLAYPASFSGNERIVHLKGEAFFDIASSADRPFIVQTDESQTTVLGTRFNIWSRNQRTRIAVEEGKVKFENENNSVVLIEGEGSISANNSLHPKINIDSGTIGSWRHNQLSFYFATLPEISGELERVFGKQVRLEVTAPETFILTGEFEKSSLATVLSSISLALNLEYRMDGDYIVFFQQE